MTGPSDFGLCVSGANESDALGWPKVVVVVCVFELINVVEYGDGNGHANEWFASAEISVAGATFGNSFGSSRSG